MFKSLSAGGLLGSEGSLVMWSLCGVSEEEVRIFYLEGHSLGQPGYPATGPMLSRKHPSS